MRVSIQQLYQASRHCQQGKAKGAECQRYQARLLDELFDTQTALQSNAWQPAPMQVFVADNGSKPREICAPAYRDRVVHHWFVPQLQALIEPKFIVDCAANMKGKGTHFAVNRLQKMMRSLQASTAATKPLKHHYLQLDIANFFYTVNHDILLTLLAGHLRRAVRDKKVSNQHAHDLLSMCQRVLTKPGLSIRNQHRAKLNQLPAHKRISNCDVGVGLPIGNLSSQFFSNVILNELDQFVKHNLKCKHYVRYVDDFVLLANNPAQLEYWRVQIESFLANKLALRLKPEQHLKPINSGVDFLGYIVRPYSKLTRKRVLHNWQLKLTAWRAQTSGQKGRLSSTVDQFATNDHMSPVLSTRLESLQSICVSYLGHCMHANSYNGIHKLVKNNPWLHHFFVIGEQSNTMNSNKNNQKNRQWGGPNWQPRWKPKAASTFKQQCDFFKHQFSFCEVVLMQKGNQFVTLKAAKPAGQAVNTALSDFYWATLLPNEQTRPNNAQALNRLTPLLRHLKQQNFSFAWVSEQGYVHNRLKKRQLSQLFLPATHSHQSLTV